MIGNATSRSKNIIKSSNQCSIKVKNKVIKVTDYICIYLIEAKRDLVRR